MWLFRCNCVTKNDLAAAENRLKQFILQALSGNRQTLEQLTEQLKQSDDVLQSAIDKQKDTNATGT